MRSLNRVALLTICAVVAVAAVCGGYIYWQWPVSRPNTLSPDLAHADIPGGYVLNDATTRELLKLNTAENWNGLKKAAVKALATLQAQRNGNNAQLASAMTWVAKALEGQGSLTQAEPLFRKALAIREKIPGADVGGSLDELAGLLDDEGRYRDAEPLYRQALARQQKIYGTETEGAGIEYSNLANLLLDAGRYREAEPLFRRSLSIYEKIKGPASSDTGIVINNLAMVMRYQGQFSQAEPLFRQSLAIFENILGPNHPDLASSLNSLGLTLQYEARYKEAEPLVRRALAIDEKSLGPSNPDTALALASLGGVLVGESRYTEAEPLYRRALAIYEKVLGPSHPQAATVLQNLGAVFARQGRYREAEPFFRRALAIREKSLGADHPDTASSLNELAENLVGQSRFREADPLLRRAISIREKMLGTAHPSTISVRETLATVDRNLARFGEAVAMLRPACALRAQAAGVPGINSETAQQSTVRVNDCSKELSLALWGWSSKAGGLGSDNRADGSGREAFGVAQDALQSAAGDALARSAALTAAESSGVGDKARAYEAAIVARDALDQRFATVAGAAQPGSIERLDNISRDRETALANIKTLGNILRTKASRYWDYRSPTAVSVTALQSRDGVDATLLRKNEALILFMVPPGAEHGLVFAVTKEKFAWARIALSGDAIGKTVRELRAQIDPLAYNLSGSANKSAANSEVRQRSFNRQAAYSLYLALLGDRKIQEVIKDKSTWLITPSGPLVSLPPALLVTSPPRGGLLGNSRPAELRATAWLLRTRSLAVLPTVSSLRQFRQLLPAAGKKPTDPLLVFANPDFGGFESFFKRSVPRGFSSYYHDGVPQLQDLKYLPALPGTLIEAKALQRALGANSNSVLSGARASKAQLMARNADGRLKNVRVLEFATHGLVAGDFSGLSEPALVLAAGVKPEDIVLRASEASTLKLNADWVLLSACNTASPDAPEAEGLSGLTRAFFFAGARSLIVSHWRVGDDTAARLIPSMLALQRNSPAISKADALRIASLAILDDSNPNDAFPFAWAPFELVGEPDR